MFPRVSTKSPRKMIKYVLLCNCSVKIAELQTRCFRVWLKIFAYVNKSSTSNLVYIKTEQKNLQSKMEKCLIIRKLTRSPFRSRNYNSLSKNKTAFETNRSPCSFFNQNQCLSVFSVQCCRTDQGCIMFKTELREQINQRTDNLKIITAVSISFGEGTKSQH